MSLSKLTLVGVAAATLAGCFTYQEPPQWKPDLTKMAYTVDYKSDEVTEIEDDDYAPLSTTKLAGRVRIAYFNFAGSADITVGEKIALARIPKGSRIVQANVYYSALGGNANSALTLSAVTVSGGTSDGSFVGVNINNDATSALNYGVYINPANINTVTTDEVVVIATVATADAGMSSPIIRGCVYYVQD